MKKKKKLPISSVVVYPKGMNLYTGKTLFPFKVDPFSEGAHCTGSKQEAAEVVSNVEK